MSVQPPWPSPTVLDMTRQYGFELPSRITRTRGRVPTGLRAHPIRGRHRCAPAGGRQYVCNSLSFRDNCIAVYNTTRENVVDDNRFQIFSR
jgi:hypothetical protein